MMSARSRQPRSPYLVVVAMVCVLFGFVIAYDLGGWLLAIVASIGLMVAVRDVEQLMLVSILILLILEASFPSLVPTTAAFAGSAALLVFLSVRHKYGARPDLSQPSSIVYASLALFFGWGFLSFLWTDFPMEVAVQSLGAVAIIGPLAFMSLGRWRDPMLLHSDLRLVLWVLIATVVAGMFRDLFGGYSGRMRGFQANANAFSYLAVSAYCLAFSRPSRGRAKWPFLLAQSLMFVAIVLSQSRISVAAVLVSSAMIFLRGDPTRKSLTIVSWFGLVLLSGWLVIISDVPRILVDLSDRFRGGSSGSSSDPRGNIWEFSLELWRSRPVGGIGFRTAEVAFESERSLATLAGVEDYIFTSHSGYIQVLLEMGVVGLLLLLLSLIVLLKESWSQPWLLHRDRVGLEAALLSGLVLQLTTSTILGLATPYAFLFWFVVFALMSCTTPAAPVQASMDTADSRFSSG